MADRYTVERELGAGGMAIVYLATDPKLNRKVAIKVLRAELAATIGIDRFVREVELTSQLEHPNILSIFDAGRYLHPGPAERAAEVESVTVAAIAAVCAEIGDARVATVASQAKVTLPIPTRM